MHPCIFVANQFGKPRRSQQLMNWVILVTKTYIKKFSFPGNGEQFENAEAITRMIIFQKLMQKLVKFRRA